MSEHQSLKEYWSIPTRNRRNSAGRREDDYAVCSQHDEIMQSTKERVCRRDASMQAIREEAEKDLAKHEEESEQKFKNLWEALIALRNEMVGKFTFRIVISFVGIVIVLISLSNSFLLQKIVRDIDELQTAVTTLTMRVK